MKQSCSKKEFKITRYLHIFSIMVVIAGTSYNMYAASNNKETGLWLPLALAIMIILRLPNQICVAKNERDGWLSVFGSTMGLISYIATVIIILHYNSKKGGPTSSPHGGEQVEMSMENPENHENPENRVFYPKKSRCIIEV